MIGRLSCIMPYLSQSSVRACLVRASYLVAKSAHPRSNRLLNDIEATKRTISALATFPWPGRPHLYILPLSMVLVEGGAIGDRGRLGSMAPADAEAGYGGFL